MQRKWHRGLVAAVAATAMFGVGCAQQVGDIDRTQPDKIKKAIFEQDAEWYYLQTVSDTDMQGSVYFESAMSGLKRVRFEITEEILFACTTFTPAIGGEDQWNYDSDPGCQGVVAAFPITSHFDVQRAYNSATGEQQNVIQENTTDRPWYDREYMRVDWSTNMVDGSQMFAGQLGGLAPAKFAQPQQWGDKINPDRTRLSEDYIDTTTNVYFEPDIMACYGTFGYDAIYNCEGGQFKIRNSFKRIPKDKTLEYEAMQYLDSERLEDEDGNTLRTTQIRDAKTGSYVEVACTPEVGQFMKENFGSNADERCRPAVFNYHQRFGYFRTENLEWNALYGSNSDPQRRYYANRWNIWEKVKTADGEAIPFSERTPKPIVYHLNPEYPRDMIAAAEEVERQWNESFLEAAARAKYPSDSLEDGKAKIRQELIDAGHESGKMYEIRQNSCMPSQLATWYTANGEQRDNDVFELNEVMSKALNGASVPGEAAALEEALWDVPLNERVQLCANLEWATQNRPQGEQFTYQRLGDLRYAMFNWVDEFNGFWSGYGPSAADPLTGEIVHATANFAGSSLRMTAMYATDLIQYMNGELDDRDIDNFEQVKNYFDKVQAEGQAARTRTLNPKGRELILQRSGVDPETITHGDGFSIDDLPEEMIQLGRAGLERKIARAIKADDTARRADTRRQELYEMPEVKSRMLADPDIHDTVVAVAAESQMLVDPDQEAIHQAYVEMHSPHLIHDRLQTKSRFMAEHNIMAPDNLRHAVENLATYQGVADAFKGVERSKIMKYFLNKLFIGTQLHEVGHTVGLRHNFIASTDAINYHDAWWDIRKAINNGVLTEQEATSIKPELAKSILGMEKWNELNDANKQLLGQDLRYINEAEFRLASVMDYTGDLTGRFQGLGKYDQTAINFAYGEVVEQWDESGDLELPNLYSYNLWFDDYRKYPNTFAEGVSDPTERVSQGIEHIKSSRKYVPIKSAKEQMQAGILGNTTNWTNQDWPERPWQNNLVPVEFCSDEWRGSILNCDVFDWGSNQQEILANGLTNYRLFQTFRRDRRQNLNKLNESLNSYFSRVLGTMALAQEAFRYYSFYRYYDLGDYTDTLLQTALEAYNFFGEVLATPTPGTYCKYDPNEAGHNSDWYYDLQNTYIPASRHSQRGSCGGDIELPMYGYAQPYGYRITDEYLFRIDYVGSFIDKMAASNAFFNFNTNFAQNVLLTDSRATSAISFWTLFRDETLNIIRGSVLEDYRHISGTWSMTGGYQPPRSVDPENFGLGVQNDQTNLVRVVAPYGFNETFNFLAGGMVSANSYFDRYIDFGQYVKIHAGEGNATQDLDPSIKWREYIEPTSGQVYRAAQTADGKSITVQLIDWANDLREDHVQAQDQLEIERNQMQVMLNNRYNPMTRPDGYTDEQIDTQRANVRNLLQSADIAEQQLGEVVAKLEQLRFLWAALPTTARR